MTEPLASLLASLSCLVTLSVDIQCSDVGFFSQLTQLTDVSVYGRSAVALDSGALVAALSHCGRIRKLVLFALSKLTDDHLAKLLPSFPQLESFTLHDLCAVESLRFLATPSLAASLTSVLVALPQCCPSELSHLLSLRSLQVVTVWHLPSPLSAELQAELAVPSKRLPNLRKSSIDRGL